MLRSVLIISLLLQGASTAWANPVRTEKTESQLVSEVSAIAPGEPFDVALRLRPDPGWHTYWKNPGDSGAGPTIRWKLPEGFEAGELRWPPPVRIAIPPLLDFGYTGESFLIARITPPAGLKPGSEAKLDASVRWLVCEDVCIPGKAELGLTLPVKAAPATKDPRWERRFEQARRELPVPLEGWQSRAALEGSTVVLRLEPPPGESLARYRQVDFFPDQQGVFDHAKQPPVELHQGALVFRLPRSRASDVDLREVTGVLVVKRDAGRQLETRSFEVRAELKRPLPAAEGGWARILFFAFVGGLLLNLMPCVFPVISMKVLGFASKAGGGSVKVRSHALLFALGVLISFWALALLLIGARAAGQGLGWGFQLQSPVFVAALALLFFALGLNLLGVFEIGGRWMGLGSSLAAGGGYSGSFFSGVLATVVATPCTAPFMGAALGFALAQPAPVALLVFTFLGLGMLAPYLALALSPGLLSRLPKPGRWMESLKQLMAFPLFATCVWLLWTLSLQTHADILARVLGGMVAIALGVWAWQRWSARGWVRAAGGIVAVLGTAFALDAAYSGRSPAEGIEWRKWSEARVEALQAEGKPAFVDFTAAWCITCQVNKRVALGAPEVSRRFEELGLVPLRADWTSYDPEITRALESMGRSGVPVYAVYPGRPGEGPVLLPEVLTTGIVLSELDRIFPTRPDP